MHHFLHTANVLYLLAYLVRDILWLRILTIVGILCLIPYYYFRTEPMIEAIIWNLVFAGINIVQVCFLFLQRRPVQFTDEEKRLYAMVFRSLTPHEMASLLEFAEWRTADSGEELCQQEEQLEDIMLIHLGACSVRIDGNEVASIGQGQFLGEMSFLTNAAATASVVATEHVEFVAWPRERLRTFLQSKAELRSLLQAILGIDLAHKLHKAS